MDEQQARGVLLGVLRGYVVQRPAEELVRWGEALLAWVNATLPPAKQIGQRRKLQN